MARPEPNISSQKCGKRCAGADRSTRIVSEAARAVAAEFWGVCPRTALGLCIRKEARAAHRDNAPARKRILQGSSFIEVLERGPGTRDVESATPYPRAPDWIPR